MSAASAIAYGFIAVAFVSFFVMSSVMYGQFVVRAWRPFFMSLAVLLILIAIMKRATDIVVHEQEAGVLDGLERPVSGGSP